MNVFIVGGTGLLGCAAAEEFIKRGDSVKTIALPGVPEGTELPEKMEIFFGNYISMSDDELEKLLDGCDCIVFAGGVDERVEFPAPIYPSYIKYNIEPTERFLRLAKKAGATKAVVLGSYFTYLNRIRPDLQLTSVHPYIKSRCQQEKVALSFADEQMSVAVMELPYIFGAQKGRTPVWTIFAEKILSMGPVTMWPKGGTAAITTRQVAEAIVGAAYKNQGGNIYPVASVNYTWEELMKPVHVGMGMPDRKFMHVPEVLFRAYAALLQGKAMLKGLEPGLNYVELSRIMYTEVFIDTEIAMELGITKDDVNAAVIDSFEISMDALENKDKYIAMVAE